MKLQKKLSKIQFKNNYFYQFQENELNSTLKLLLSIDVLDKNSVNILNLLY